ncbi:helix-turn-helix domain-containing protein [Deefgea salmonis]|uniref:Helix-turn-helix domain-containing protein n=1 Tax=Deefgea salmonis TaxID=2875502 RepID=A0ABS8BIZ8_9NEIS|nr:helix-turn-helix transcriptional regulator [Deefgea salmonis]MCB5195695.1 helix-turn-helix domain-containing protein [Deefgea salmonis]
MNEYDHLRQQLGKRVKARRRQQRLSQETLAFQAEIDRTYVSQIERGISNPSLHVLCKIAEALLVSVTDLLSEPESATE